MLNMENFTNNYRAVEARLQQACLRAKRDLASIRILPVTKTHPPEYVQVAYQYGFREVGENRVQEAVDKMPACPDDLQWELIGHLQSNKARLAASHFARIQSVDSEKLLRKLDTAAELEGRKLRILLQLNAGDDPAKFGAPCEDAPALLDTALGCGHLKVDGLMTIAPLSNDPDVARRCFTRLRETRDQLADRFSVALPELSMGMSGDLEAAVEAGSTLIRVGTALFGSRE